MEYREKLERLDEHLKKHPKDYQAVISRLTTYSDAVMNERRKRAIERVREVAKYRRMLNEK